MIERKSAVFVVCSALFLNDGAQAFSPIVSRSKETRAFLQESSRNMSNEDNNGISSRSNEGIFKKIVAASCSVALAFNLSLGVADAAVAPLADVGLREYLVKDGNELLRLSIPTSLPQSSDAEKVGDVGRVVQEHIELVRLRLEQVGFSGKTQVWNACYKEVGLAKSSLAKLDAPQSEKDMLDKKLDLLGEAIRKQDITPTLDYQEQASSVMGEIRLKSLPAKTISYTIPDEYANLPRLLGRAKVKCEISKSKGSFRLEDGSLSKNVELELIIDGYHAPLTAGNFVDLASRGFYNNMPLKSEGELLVESQDIDFIDPNTKEARTIPLELWYKKDMKPVYEYTSDEDMRATEGFSLPFQAYGALGMEHDPEDVNTGSSKFWFLRWDQGLVSPGRNTLDGSHACFGYAVKNQDFLKQISSGDTIQSMKVVEGKENLVIPK